MTGDVRTRRTFYLWVLLGFAELGACGLDPSLHPQPGGASGGAGPDVDGSVVLSAGGAETWDASNALFGTGNDSSSAGISGSGGIGSGASDSASGGLGGATHAGGAASAGGSDSSTAGGLGPAGAADADASVAPPPLPHALLFSEYVEGSSTNKALEIAALVLSSLSGCAIETYFNGRSDLGATVPLTGVLEAGAVWTVCTSALASVLGPTCNQVANLTFNGNDALLLRCDGAPLDAIGQIGFDPGTSWGSGDVRTADHSLRRACSVSHGDPVADDAFDPALEWLAYPSDSFDGLGTRGCAAPSDGGSEAATETD